MQNGFELAYLFKRNKRKTEDVLVRVLYTRQKGAVRSKMRVGKTEGGEEGSRGGGKGEGRRGGLRNRDKKSLPTVCYTTGCLLLTQKTVHWLETAHLAK